MKRDKNKKHKETQLRPITHYQLEYAKEIKEH